MEIYREKARYRFLAFIDIRFLDFRIVGKDCRPAVKSHIYNTMSFLLLFNYICPHFPPLLSPAPPKPAPEDNPLPTAPVHGSSIHVP